MSHILEHAKELVHLHGIGYIAVGLVGGLARIALSVPGVDSVFKEFMRLIFIAAPIAYFVGAYVEHTEFIELAYPITFIAGMLSLNIARSIMTLKLDQVKALISTFGGKK